MQAEVARREICKLETVNLAEAGACLGHHWLLRKSLDVPCKSSEVMMILGKSCKGVSESAAIRGPAAQVAAAQLGGPGKDREIMKGKSFSTACRRRFCLWLRDAQRFRLGSSQLQPPAEVSTSSKLSWTIPQTRGFAAHAQRLSSQWMSFCGPGAAGFSSAGQWMRP